MIWQRSVIHNIQRRNSFHLTASVRRNVKCRIGAEGARVLHEQTLIVWVLWSVKTYK